MHFFLSANEFMPKEILCDKQPGASNNTYAYWKHNTVNIIYNVKKNNVEQ